MSAGTRIRILAAAALVLAMAGVYWLLHDTGAIAILLDGHALRQYVMGLGMAGPLAIVALMILAILVSPIPSAPIAPAAFGLARQPHFRSVLRPSTGPRPACNLRQWASHHVRLGSYVAEHARSARIPTEKRRLWFDRCH